MTEDRDADRTDLISVVVPVFNESEVIAEFYHRATETLSRLEGLEYELLFVDDGSLDDSFEQLATLAKKDPHVRILKFSRNFGHQIAITAGVDHAKGDCIVIIDADLQDPPEVIGEMAAKWREGYDVVYGRRIRRKGERPFKRFTAMLFYRVLRRMTKIQIPVDVGDFRLISRKAATHLTSLRERDRFVRGLVSWIGFRQTMVDFKRDPRFAGGTSYPLGRMLRFAIDGITSFSTVPLRLATWLGWAASILAFLYLLSVPVQHIFGITVPGLSTVMVALLFLGGAQLICLGILGEYVGRIFRETKQRPIYIVDREIQGEVGSRRPDRPDRSSSDDGSAPGAEADD